VTVDRVRKILVAALEWAGRRLWLILVMAAFVVTLGGEGMTRDPIEDGVEVATADVRFDFVEWEAGAIWAKVVHWLLQPQRYMSEPDRSDLVREYSDLVFRVNDLEGEIEAVYADPAVADPERETADARQQLASLREMAIALQLTAESIFEEQVGVVLAQERLGFALHPFPPVGLHFTPPPRLLVISQRDRIETIRQEELEAGLDVARQEAIEEEVDSNLGVSSLVTGIGGMSAWPAMVIEWPDIRWAMEVTAHEWTHHYLSLYPLGWEYVHNQETRTINETTASIVGDEVGLAVLTLYYPDLVPPPPEPPGSEESDEPPAEPPAFDFRAEMYETRVEVDRLLGEGSIEEAEQYMEARRAFFVENGYRIRKLNQAYFAFHGSYAAEPGAAGEDPIGPAVRELREQSGDLRTFLTRVSTITTFDELQATLAGLR
jgi:hypothetical protein